MAMLERVSAALFFALLVTLPFELRTFPIVSNLQWVFLAVALVNFPNILRNRRKLAQDPLVIGAVVFVAANWIAAFAASEFETNALKGAIRISAGFALLCATLCLHDRRRLMRTWCISAVVAAAYAILDYSGFGLSSLFRDAEFYFGDVRRLSGSFEYPNTAAAFFAMSLPIVWTTIEKQSWRFAASILLWVVLILTYSRGAMAAVTLVLVAWAVATKLVSPLRLCAAGLACYAALSVVQPFLVQRLQEIQPDKGLAAEYHPEFTQVHLRPNDFGELKINVKNLGSVTWLPDGERPVTISYHWYDTENKRLAPVAAIHTPVPTTVRPQESVSINASFRTPHEAGSFLLVWDLAQEGRGWFSAAGVVPGVVETRVQADGELWHGNGDVSRWLQPKGPVADGAISRAALWKSALSLARKHPVLGVGPDNFRLMYGRELGYATWDSNVRANSLYLELLAGSGIVGLLGFAFMMSRVPRRASAAVLAIGVFLVHGLVDVFLMTTPIYFGFWILLGEAHED